MLVILCLAVCEQAIAGQGGDVCAELGMLHQRSARGEDGAAIVFCSNSTDGTVRGVTHIGQLQVSV